jgi:signal transduction histidine kinase
VDLPAVLVDSTLFSRAVTNVIENAIQAMPGGGRVSVSAERSGGHVVLRVADTGVGMDPVATARAFEPYFSTKTAGSGLGLPNARRNLELSGATITLESALGQGTIVTITLPVADSPGTPADA